MNNLNLVKKEGQLMADSRDVAMMVDKRHDNLVRDIEKYIEGINKLIDLKIEVNSNDLKIEVVKFFVESYYLDSKGESRKHYYITRKGCDMIAIKK